MKRRKAILMRSVWFYGDFVRKFVCKVFVCLFREGGFFVRFFRWPYG